MALFFTFKVCIGEGDHYEKNASVLCTVVYPVQLLGKNNFIKGKHCCLAIVLHMCRCNPWIMALCKDGFPAHSPVLHYIYFKYVFTFVVEYFLFFIFYLQAWVEIIL